MAHHERCGLAPSVQYANATYDAIIAELIRTDESPADLRTERDRLAAAVERVRALHRRERMRGGYTGCVLCGTVWPCSTARALDDATERGDG